MNQHAFVKRHLQTVAYTDLYVSKSKKFSMEIILNSYWIFIRIKIDPQYPKSLYDYNEYPAGISTNSSMHADNVSAYPPS